MVISVIIALLPIAIFFIINVIDNNKEEIMQKLKIEKKEIMKCSSCFKEYDDLKLKNCLHCGSNVKKRIKYIIPEKLKKKIIYGLIVVTIIIIGILIYLGISCMIKEKQRNEKYNNDIYICYETIRNESNYNKFKSIVDEHTREANFRQEAYNNLYKAVDDRIESLKNGNDDKDLITMLEDIKKREISNKEIEERYLKANSYSNIIQCNKYIEEQKFKEAYDLFGAIINDNKDKNQDIVDIATNKQNEIKDKAFEQIVAQAQEKINAQNYSSAQTLLSTYKDLGNQTILDMYNNATNEVNRIEAERKAKQEAERKKEAEEEQKRKQEELNAKKDKIVVNTNGKKIYKVCMQSNTFSISGNFKGSGYFGIKLLDSNQDLYKLLANEIGDYVVNKSVSVTKGAYYYIQIECTEGSWNLSWWGTYGD